MDYTKLGAEDEKVLAEPQEKEIVYLGGKPSGIRKSLRHLYPKAARHFLSRFPNKHVDRLELSHEKAQLTDILEKLKALIDDKSTTEQAILNFLKNEDAKFIPASIISRGYNFGHHGLYVFPEFPLTVSHQPDFLLVGKNSDGYHFVFVELENPYKDIVLANGTYGTTLRKGIIQVEDWHHWLQKNLSHLKPVFEKDKKHGELLPDEFTEYDQSRFHFVVVAGRRDDFKEETYRRNRELHQSRSIQIMHYDNLMEDAAEVLQKGSF